jgi:hypothetical protein
MRCGGQFRTRESQCQYLCTYPEGLWGASGDLSPPVLEV